MHGLTLLRALALRSILKGVIRACICSCRTAAWSQQALEADMVIMQARTMQARIMQAHMQARTLAPSLSTGGTLSNAR